MEVLIVQNTEIENFEGISKFEELKIIDVSYNPMYYTNEGIVQVKFSSFRGVSENNRIE